ncbi:MAG: nitroreductase family protein [Alphaproteobacteria bacterium]
MTTKSYQDLMEVIRDRRTSRAFDPSFEIPQEHYNLILEAARHGPSGANAQPWHFIVVTEPERKEQLGDYFVAEARRRGKLKMKFPTPNYAGMKSAPGLIVVVGDFRYTRAFPVLGDGSDLDKMYNENAERILLQSVAAATMSAHLAATALGYAVWWVTAIGQEEAQSAFKPLLDVPDDLSVLDIMCFGLPAQPPYKRWKKDLDEIRSWNRFDMSKYQSAEDIDDWILNARAKVMYKDESLVD